MHIINILKARLLLSLDILKLKGIIINLNHKIIIIQSYNSLIIPIQIYLKNNEYIQQNIFPLFKIIIPVHTKTKIQIKKYKGKKFLLFKNKDFLFKSNIK